jgi:hypothetical protein
MLRLWFGNKYPESAYTLTWRQLPPQTSRSRGFPRCRRIQAELDSIGLSCTTLTRQRSYEELDTSRPPRDLPEAYPAYPTTPREL